MKVDSVNVNNNNKYNFTGKLDKSVTRIFTDLAKDINADTIQKSGLRAPGKSLEILQKFVSELGDNITFLYRKPSLFRKEHGFLFKNNENKKILPAWSYKIIYMDGLIHDKNRLFIKPPSIEPEERVKIEPFKSKTLDYLSEYFSQEVYHWSRETGPYYKTHSPFAATIVDCFRMLLSIFPKRTVSKYDTFELREMNEFVDTLTKSSTHQEINKFFQ